MYVEGLVLPVKTARKDDYLELAGRIAAVYREYGATRVVECWGDNLSFGEITSFPRAVQLQEGETAVLSWMEYPDKATRDICHEKVWADPRMENVMQDQELVDGKRIVFGGFTVEQDA